MATIRRCQRYNCPEADGAKPCPTCHVGSAYGCARAGCDNVNPDWAAFGARDGRSYCLTHVPLRSRLRLWWQERRSS